MRLPTDWWDASAQRRVGLRVQGSRFRGLGFRGLGFRGLGFRGLGLGLVVGSVGKNGTNAHKSSYMGVVGITGPLRGISNIRPRIIMGRQKGSSSLTTDHMTP